MEVYNEPKPRMHIVFLGDEGCEITALRRRSSDPSVWHDNQRTPNLDDHYCQTEFSAPDGTVAIVRLWAIEYRF